VSDVVYLDHNATTPVAPEVATQHGWANPASDHAYGRAAARWVEPARAAVAALIGARADEIVFTSGGTEADNLALLGSLSGGGALLVARIEHPAVLECADDARAHWLAVGPDGRVVVPAAIPAGVGLATLMLANNETGVLQPVAELATLARRAGVPVHTDAAQAVGKIPVDVDALGVDFLTIAGHKLYAPKGIGALFVRRGSTVRALQRGGTQERGLRPGTTPVPLVAALGEACRLAALTLAEDGVRVRRLRDELGERLRAANPGLRITGETAERLPNTLHVRFPGLSGRDLLGRAPDVAASTGSACHAGREQASDVLVAMGIPVEDALGAVRLSLGRSTTADDVARAAASLTAAAHSARSLARSSS
jgi:cysteine desulfurase